MKAGRYSQCPSFQLLLFKETAALPESLQEQVLMIDPDAQIRNSWASVVDVLTTNSCAHPQTIIAVSEDCASAIRRIKELWNLRLRCNYSPRPVYFAISRTSPSPLTRYEIERWGGHVLCVSDVITHFRNELAQIRLKLAAVVRSLPSWLIVQEGNGSTLRALIYLMGRHRPVRIQGSDRLIAALAAFIKHNGITRSISAWQDVLADDALFIPGGGGFKVPSRASLKMYLHRDFPKYLQQAFEEERSGYSAKRVIECVNPGTWATEYGIRGEWEVIRK